MTSRSNVAPASARYSYYARQRSAGKLSAAIASGLTALRLALERWTVHRRFALSIAHLDDRLLADIGLGWEDLGFAERVARRRASGFGTSAGTKAGPGTDWQ